MGGIILYKNILVAYDGSPLSQQAITVAKNQIKNEENAKIDIVNVIRSTGPRTNVQLARSMHEDLKKEKLSELAPLKDEFPKDDADISIEVLISENNENPGKQICQYAEEKQIDLIIMGSRGLGKVRKILLGSVSNYVVQRAMCPIFIVK